MPQWTRLLSILRVQKLITAINMDASFDNVIEREKEPRRAAAAKVQYKFDDGDEDEEDICGGGGDGVHNKHHQTRHHRQICSVLTMEDEMTVTDDDDDEYSPRTGMASGVGGSVSPTISRKTTSASRIVISRLTFSPDSTGRKKPRNETA